jgi:hypothetical protein
MVPAVLFAQLAEMSPGRSLANLRARVREAWPPGRAVRRSASPGQRPDDLTPGAQVLRAPSRGDVVAQGGNGGSRDM